MHLHCQETPLKDFLHGIVSLYRFNAQERNSTLELKEDESLSSDKGKLKVWIDRINFDKVISNLLSKDVYKRQMDRLCQGTDAL